VVERIFGDIFRTIGINSLAGANDMFSFQNGKRSMTNKPLNMLFTAMPSVDKKVSLSSQEGEPLQLQQYGS
jgi:hypothetical protein